MTMTFEPYWKPLEAEVGKAAEDYMFMGTVEATESHPAIHLFKHVMTRDYLNLDDAGRHWVYVGGDYVAVPR